MNQEKFLRPSVVITEAGRNDARLVLARCQLVAFSRGGVLLGTLTHACASPTFARGPDILA